jgi:multidrug efflux pump subunit AcrB
MTGLIRFSLNNWHAVIVFSLTIVVLGVLSVVSIPIDILPVNPAAAVQVLTFNNGMPATNVETAITARLERWTGQAAGTALQTSRSIAGVSIVRNYYNDTVDPNAALTQCSVLATAAIPYLPPGTLPPVVLPFDPTATTPVCLVALDSQEDNDNMEAILYDTGRYEVRKEIMTIRGAVAPVVYGGKLRAVLVRMDWNKMLARNLSPVDLLNALEKFNVFLPTGSVKLNNLDYALDSNSLYELVIQMEDIPIKSENGHTIYLKDVGTPEDTALVQTNIVRVNGRKQVYIPVYRQQGSSTLSVVENIIRSLPDIEGKLTHGGIKLEPVMDQSVYVRHSINSLVEEGILGAVLCSLVILIFLGEWRMTIIAVLTIPIAVCAAVIGLNYTGNTLNVMTLAGLALAIGPLVDSAIICLENTHRHLGLGVEPKEAALFGASEVALPELVAACCTLLVLAPLAFMAGMGRFLFRPMALAVTFAMVSAYLLSRTLVPTLCMMWLKVYPHAVVYHGVDHGDRSEHERHEVVPPRGWYGKIFDRWEGLISSGIARYVTLLQGALRNRLLVISAAAMLMIAVVVGLGSQLRREFFPEVDAGAFEMYVRARTGMRIEETERHVTDIEQLVKDRLGHDLKSIISEIGVVADWSAAYTPNAGPMDAVIRIQLHHDRQHSAQEWVQELRKELTTAPEFSDMEYGFNAGGMIRGALNQGKSTPINIQITSKSLQKGHAVAEAIQDQVKNINGVVDCRIRQRLDYPQYIVDVDRAKAADLGLNQYNVMTNLVAALNSSIQFNKRIFWVDPKNQNQYYVGVMYAEKDIQSVDTLLDVPINSPVQKTSIPLRTVATARKAEIPSELNHRNLQQTVDLTMNVQGRDLGHVADDVAAAVAKFGEQKKSSVWVPFDPDLLRDGKQVPMEGSVLRLTGEYLRMQETFVNLSIGLVLASMLIYFLMVALFRSWLTPLVILSAVPVGLVGVVSLLFITGTAINVQSLLGVIFMVGIVVSNTVLLVDFAQNLRKEKGLTPTQAILQAASVRVRPVVMTALAAFFALLPMALGLGRGTEANTPLGRAVIGGLLAGLVTTLFVVPALYSLVVRDRAKPLVHPSGGHPRSL